MEKSFKLSTKLLNHYLFKRRNIINRLNKLHLVQNLDVSNHITGLLLIINLIVVLKETQTIAL